LDSAVANPENEQLGSLVMEDGNLQLAFSEGELPQFIIDANDAIKTGRIKEAGEILNEDTVGAFQKKVEKDSCRTAVLLALAKLLYDAGKLPEAERWYKKILEREPHAFVYNALADICVALARISEAARYRKKAVETSEDSEAYLLQYALSLITTGKRDEGIDILRKRAEIAPKDDRGAAGSILLWQLHYCPESTQQMFFDEYRKWATTYLPMTVAKTSHGNNPDPDRRLRIGYISPDFRSNVVSTSFEPFLDGHDRRNFEVYGYGNITRPDEVTERFKKKFDHYRNIHGMSIGRAAQVVETDQIDILIEIGGHSRDNCLGVVALKPAPVQVDYGGINTSGMEQIDYRLTDRISTPAYMERFYVEESICLPGGILSYRPPRSSPLVGPSPAKQNGYVTFGSFNNGVKINSSTMELWARVLNCDEDSRFLLKFLGGSDRDLQEYYFGEFERLGIRRERVEICEMCRSHFSHMQLHNKVDILLDTYPFNGFMTTLEGLWMGVPTISPVGEDLSVARAGLSILSRIGLEIFASSTPDEYVAKARAFAKELDNLQKIRASLRQIMLDSDLCKPKRLTDEIEDAYRKMWHRWCRNQTAKAPA
jgi:predicted O-linked N-acetylglucosamine transferase (SPINDLY family)